MAIPNPPAKVNKQATSDVSLFYPVPRTRSLRPTLSSRHSLLGAYHEVRLSVFGIQRSGPLVLHIARLVGNFGGPFSAQIRLTRRSSGPDCVGPLNFFR